VAVYQHAQKAQGGYPDIDRAALDCIAVLAFFTTEIARARGRLGFPTCVRIHTDLAANLLQEKRKGDDR
jgi:hypothetical protein